MNFDIRLEETIKENFGENGVFGEIEINGDVEGFFSPISYWSRSDYYKSWMVALEDAWERARPAALIVSMLDPKSSQFVFAWIAYFEGENVYIQNRMIFNSRFVGKFSINNINNHIGQRMTVNEDGQRLSEWCVSRSAIMKFFLKIKKNL